MSKPACDSAMEVLAANGVEVRVAAGGEFTPTPAVSHAILVHNRGRDSGLADGIVVTPSHNPPDDGGFKYNPANGGPAHTAITSQVQDRANALHLARTQELVPRSHVQWRTGETPHPRERDHSSSRNT